MNMHGFQSIFVSAHAVGSTLSLITSTLHPSSFSKCLPWELQTPATDMKKAASQRLFSSNNCIRQNPYNEFYLVCLVVLLLWTLVATKVLTLPGHYSPKCIEFCTASLKTFPCICHDNFLYANITASIKNRFWVTNKLFYHLFCLNWPWKNHLHRVSLSQRT